MARDTPLGMEFMNWQNVPSISESFQKMAQGQFNPLGYAIGYGLDKAFGGENDYIKNLMSQQEQAFKSTYAQPVQPKPGQVAAQNPQAPSISPVPSAAPVTSILPTYESIRSTIGQIFGGVQ